MPDLPDDEYRRIRENLLRIHGQDILRDTDGSGQHFDALHIALDAAIREQSRKQENEGQLTPIQKTALGSLGALIVSALTWAAANVHFFLGDKGVGK